LLQLHRSDQEGYRKACATLITRFGKSTDASVANSTAWACALGSSALPDLRPAVALARRAVRTNTQSANFRNTLGVILYRAGQYQEAVAELNEAIQRHSKGGTAADFLFLAMAHHQLGQADEARQWLDRAKKEVEKNPPVFWSDQVELQLFRREAETLIEKPTPGGDK
jgi:Tfp pilus assembly protein PilF